MASAQKTIALQQTNYNQFIAEAKAANKPVMIYFTGTGCGLCVKMEKQVFVKPAVYELYNSSFINVESFDDSKKPDAATKELRKKYGIVSNPTFIFIDTDGKVIHKSGYQPDDTSFSKVARQALSDDNYSKWLAKIESGKFDRATLEKFLSVEQKPAIYSSTYYDCASQKALDNYFASIPQTDYSSKENWAIIQSYVANPYSPVFTHILQNQSVYNKNFGEQVVNEKIYSVLKDAWSGARNEQPYKDAEKFIRNSSNPVAALVLQMNEMKLAREELLEKKERWEDFIAKYGTFIDAYTYLDKNNSYQSTEAAKDICKRFSTDIKLVRVANKWMSDVVAAEKPDEDYYAVYANTFYLLGDMKNAIIYQQKAIATAKEHEADKADLDLYQKSLQDYQR